MRKINEDKVFEIFTFHIDGKQKQVITLFYCSIQALSKLIHFVDGLINFIDYFQYSSSCLLSFECQLMSSHPTSKNLHRNPLIILIMTSLTSTLTHPHSSILFRNPHIVQHRKNSRPQVPMRKYHRAPANSTPRKLDDAHPQLMQAAISHSPDNSEQLILEISLTPLIKRKIIPRTSQGEFRHRKICMKWPTAISTLYTSMTNESFVPLIYYIRIVCLRRQSILVIIKIFKTIIFL